jgi:hypothetical protein
VVPIPGCLRKRDGAVVVGDGSPAQWKLKKRPPTEAALLLFFGVKRSLLRLHLLYQFLDPIEHSLIGDSGRDAMVMLDLAVEFGALVTHCNSAFTRGQPR